MGFRYQLIPTQATTNMKTFFAVSALLAAAAADQASHQSIIGHGAVVSHGVQKAHGANHALVHAAPVVGPALVHAPVHHAIRPVVHHAPVAVHHAPVAVHHAPIVHRPVVHAGPAPYSYEYGVADEYSGANFGQNEVRDGYST